MTDIDQVQGGYSVKYSLILWVLVIAFIAAVFWASYFRIDEFSRGFGTVIASSRVQLIQAVDGGVLELLNVKEGDRVKQGEVLAQLDQTRVAAAVRELDAKLAGLHAQDARIRAEIAGSSKLEFTQDILQFPEIISVQRSLFKQRTRSFSAEMRTLSVAVDLAKEDALLVSELAKSGDVSRSEVIRAERARNEAEAKKINKRNKYYQELQAELAKVEGDREQNEQIRTQRAQQLKNSIITAPVAGIVKNVRITTQGGVLRAGEELMQIIPINDQLIVETKVRPADIALLKTGLPATIRFDAFDYTIYGAVDGNVLYISADTLIEETRSGEQTYYRVHVETANPVVTRTGKTLEILPGITAQVDIRTGDRTVMDFLLKPVRKTLTESLGER